MIIKGRCSQVKKETVVTIGGKEEEWQRQKRTQEHMELPESAGPAHGMCDCEKIASYQGCC